MFIDGYKLSWDEPTNTFTITGNGELRKGAWWRFEKRICRITKRWNSKNNIIVRFVPKRGLIALPEDCSYMFERTPFVLEFPYNLDTRRVVDASYMFAYTKNANPNTSLWDMSNARTLKGMFFHAEKADPDVWLWDISGVEDISYMFAYARCANPRVSLWKTKNVHCMRSCFRGAVCAKPNVQMWELHQSVIQQGGIQSCWCE